MRKIVLFTDTHFGCKNNSITWFSSQKKFIETEFIPYIEKTKPDEVIHLGDVFDIRSTVSVFIGEQVRDLFKRIAALTPRFVIIGGNHDYYSPNSDKYNSVTMILRDIENLHVYSSGVTLYNHCLYLPWYEWLDVLNNTCPQRQKVQLQTWIDNGLVKNIFTHADIWREDIPMFHSVNIFSGHIHTPRCEPVRRLYNIGSCFPLTFADSNQDRCFYELVLDDSGDITKFTPIVNKGSIRFWRFYGSEIFDKFDSISPADDDYIELYVSKQDLISSEFIKRIDKLNNSYKNLWCIPIMTDIQIDESTNVDNIVSLDMKSMIRNYIPEELMNKFQMVVNKHDESD